MKKKSVRITSLGYIVLTIIILVMAVGIYFIIWSMPTPIALSTSGSLVRR